MNINDIEINLQSDNLPALMNNLDRLASQIDAIVADILFGHEDAGLSPMAEQETLRGIDYAKLAVSSLRIAAMHQARNS